MDTHSPRSRKARKLKKHPEPLDPKIEPPEKPSELLSSRKVPAPAVSPEASVDGKTAKRVKPTKPRAWRKPKPIPWWRRWKQAGGSFLMISIGVHALLLIGAACWVVQTINAKRKLTFSAAPPSDGVRGQLEYRVQTARRAQSMSAPPAANRITTTAVDAKVALPDVSTFNPAAMVMPSRIAGISGPGVAFSPGVAKAPLSVMSAGGGALTAFGFKGTAGAGLLGAFYDLKQTANKEPLGTPADAVADLKAFVKNWDPAILAKYYRAKTELAIQRVYFPELSAVEAPRAFGVDGEVKPSLWVVHYRGKVVPPKNGTFRFRGVSSDWLAVRFDNKTVYDGGSGSVFALDKEVNQTKSVFIEMREGKTYPIEILIGNYPGGVVYANLFLEEKGKNYDKDESGEPIYQLFQIGKFEPPKLDPDAKHAPPFQKEQMIFRLAR
ncbi:MAG: hypothetical protein WCO60_03490 [Verrucomicrobiota bacterium]